MYILKAKHLYKSYHIKKQTINVLQNISLQIHKGEMIAIMGPSGSGKSTLLHNLSGIDKPDSGEIMVNGHDLASFSSEELAIEPLQKQKISKLPGSQGNSLTF